MKQSFKLLDLFDSGAFPFFGFVILLILSYYFHMLLTGLVAFLVLSVLIIVHELGHFLVAKKAGIKVEEFGLGYPPRIFGKKIGETIYSINALPFGGFVRLYGEDLKESGKDLKKAFWSKSKKARAAVTLAGVFMNFLLAIVVFSLVYSFVGIPTKTDKVIVAGVAENSPAGKAGFKEEDIILSVEGISVSGIDEFISLVAEKKGDVINVEIKREENNLCKKEEVKDIVCNGENMILAVVVREDPPEGEGSLGVLISDTEIVKYPFWKMPFYATMEGFKEAFAWTKLILGGFSQMIGSLISHGQVPKDIAGPVGIFQITGNVARSGILAILQFSAVLSVNFAVLNILPFPALDGGRLMFILYELVAGRKPNPKVEQWTNMIGMAILLGLIGLVTINDIFRIKNSF